MLLLKDTLLYLCSPVLGFNCARGCHDTYFQVSEALSNDAIQTPTFFVDSLKVVQHHLLDIDTSIVLVILSLESHHGNFFQVSL